MESGTLNMGAPLIYHMDTPDRFQVSVLRLSAELCGYWLRFDKLDLIPPR